MQCGAAAQPAFHLACASIARIEGLSATKRSRESPQDLSDRDQFVIGDATAAQFNLRDHSSFNIPAIELKLSRKIALRPLFGLSCMANPVTQRVADRLGFLSGLLLWGCATVGT